MADVTLEDQQRINAFSRLNARAHELAARAVARRAAADDLEEAGNEVMLLDDEVVPLVVGECLVHFPREEAEARLQTLQDEARAEAKALDAEAAGLRGQLAGLKAELYARFGSAINLEE